MAISFVLPAPTPEEAAISAIDMALAARGIDPTAVDTLSVLAGAAAVTIFGSMSDPSDERTVRKVAKEISRQIRANITAMCDHVSA